MSTALQKAISILKSQKNLGTAINVSQSMVSQMARGERPVPAEHCLAIERATHGAVTCEQLRPDIDWRRSTTAA